MATAAWLAAVPLAAQVGLGLAPMRVDVHAAAGSPASGVLMISNETGAAVRVRADMLDFSIDSSETPQFSRAVPAEAAYSCRAWLALNPVEFELAPHQQAPVRYTIRVPAAAAPRSYHCAAGFTTLPTLSQLESTGIRSAVRIVSAFYAVVGQPAVEGEIREMRFVCDRAGVCRPVVVLENYSDMHFRAIGTLDVLDAGGKVVQSARFNTIPVLPKRQQRFLFPLPLPEGTYTLHARVDLGMTAIQDVTAMALAARQ